jgi:hypothetical protein
MREFKVEKIENEYKFSIKNFLENIQANNSTLRARHWKMFKKDTYEFEPIKELVLTMHFGFIWQIDKRLESYLQGMARQIEAAFEECREQINQADLLKMTDWYIEFGFNDKEDTFTNREEWLTGGDWGQGWGRENYRFARLG